MVIHTRLFKRRTVCQKFLGYNCRPCIFSLSCRNNRGINSEITFPSRPSVPKSSKFRHAVRICALGLFCSGAGFIMAAMPAFKVADSFLKPPTDYETLSLFTPEDDESREVEAFINNHPFALSIRSKHELSESRPHLRIPEPLRVNNLIAGTLMGSELLVVPPLVWVDEEGHSFVSIIYLGRNLCGHPNIIHGGLLATLLDEGLARCCFTAFPNKVGMTASLNVDYRSPTPAGSYVVLRAKVTAMEGRKAWATGYIETLVDEGEKPVMLAEASGLFVEPRQAATMAKIYPAV